MKIKKKSKPVSRSMGRMSYGTHSLLSRRDNSTRFMSDGIVESREDNFVDLKTLRNDIKPEESTEGRGTAPHRDRKNKLLRNHKYIPEVIVAFGDYGESVWIRGIQVKTPIIY